MTEMTQCVNDGGLINPANFPCKSADLDTGAITGSAASLRGMGQAVDDKTGAIHTTWTRLGGCYEAPEQEQVYTLLDPAVTSAADLFSRFGDAATHLDTYAHALDGIKPRLADLEQRAASFRASVVNGVEVPASAAKDAGFGDHMAWAFDWVPGVDEKMVTVPWTEDGDSVDKNTHLLDEYAQILSDISAAVATCANGVNGLVTGMCVAPVETIPAEAFTAGEVAMPWGMPATEDRNCRESVGHGAAEFGTGFAQGLGMLVLGYNPENGGWFEGSAYGQAWGGLGDLAGSLVLMASPVGWVAAGMAATGHNNNGFSDFMYDRAVVLQNAGGALVGWSPEDGWDKWSEDGVAAGTESVLNIGTFFIPGAGEVAGGLKAGSMGARVIRIAGAASEFVVQGGSWVMKGGVRVVTHIAEVSRRFDLGEFMESVRPRMVTTPDGMRVPVIRGPGPGGWFNAMVEGPSNGGHTPGEHHTPVSGDNFGSGDHTPGGGSTPNAHVDPPTHSEPTPHTDPTGHHDPADGTHDPGHDSVNDGTHDPATGHDNADGGTGHDNAEPVPGHTPLPDPEAEAARIHALGDDPAVKQYRPEEAATAHRVEEATGQTLERYDPKPGEKGDWVDPATGHVYDGCSPAPSQYFDKSMPKFEASMERHLNHQPQVDTMVVDVTDLNLSPGQVARLESYLDGLPAADQARIMRIGF